jgi:hypothetical protein
MNNSVLTLKSVATGVFLTVLSRQVYTWFEDRLKRTDLLFDLVDIKDDKDSFEVDIILKNYSGSVTQFKGRKLMAFLDGDLVASGNINPNLFLLNDGQVMILENIKVVKHKKTGAIDKLAYKLIANIDGIDTNVKAFESNEHGAVFNQENAEIVKAATHE